MKNNKTKKPLFSSPNQVGEELEEMNKDYQCPVCEKHYIDKEELEFIAVNGRCMTCDKIAVDVMEQEIDQMKRDDAKEQEQEMQID